MFLKYTPDDYTKHGYLKPPVGFYLIMVFLLRAYVVWVVSLANRRDRTSFIEWAFPNQYDFFIGLITGIAAVAVVVMFTFRKEKSYDWVEKCWPMGIWLLWLSWGANLVLTIWSIQANHFKFEPGHALVLLGLFFAMLFMIKSDRLKDFFADWPEKLESQKTKEDNTVKQDSEIERKSE